MGLLLLSNLLLHYELYQMNQAEPDMLLILQGVSVALSAVIPRKWVSLGQAKDMVPWKSQPEGRCLLSGNHADYYVKKGGLNSCLGDEAIGCKPFVFTLQEALLLYTQLEGLKWSTT